MATIMNYNEAADLLSEYGDVLKVGDAREPARKASTLPASICKIRYAFFVVIENLIKNSLFDNAFKDACIDGYGRLNVFLHDRDADAVNSCFRKMLERGETLTAEESQLHDNFIKKMYPVEDITNFMSYITECENLANRQ